MKQLMLSLMILVNINLYAHGMNELGPNKGYISMPGTFHTEVVPAKDGQLKIYLLDINFENAVTKNSNVELSYLQANKQIEFNCTAKDTYFSCVSLKKIDLNKGKLLLKATRQNVKASNVAEYQLPLSLK